MKRQKVHFEDGGVANVEGSYFPNSCGFARSAMDYQQSNDCTYKFISPLRNYYFLWISVTASESVSQLIYFHGQLWNHSAFLSPEAHKLYCCICKALVEANAPPSHFSWYSTNTGKRKTTRVKWCKSLVLLARTRICDYL